MLGLALKHIHHKVRIFLGAVINSIIEYVCCLVLLIGLILSLMQSIIEGYCVQGIELKHSLALSILQ